MGERHGGWFGEETAGLVGLSEIRDAAVRIQGVALRTPLLLIDDDRGRVWLKCESLQPTGAFKIRGAYNFVARLDPARRALGVITYSSGNHGQAVAYAARAFGVPATVVMPLDAPRSKMEATRRFGAKIELCGTLSTERGARARELAAASGSPIVPPFDDPDIIAGQGTVGLEILHQLQSTPGPSVSGVSQGPVVVVPVGGGGLISGVAAALHFSNPGALVVGVEPEGAASMKLSLEAGSPVTLQKVETIADGLRPVTPGELTFRHCRALVDRVVTVSDDEIRRGVAWCFAHRLVVEPSGAAALAAVLGGHLPAGQSGRPTVAVISGGNVGWRRLQELLVRAEAGSVPAESVEAGAALPGGDRA